jgi:hypothetical protein
VLVNRLGEATVNEVERRLCEIIGLSTYEEACAQVFRNAFLHGTLDRMLANRQISSQEDSEARECIAALGQDEFAQDFDAIFGSEPVNNLCRSQPPMCLYNKRDW